MLSLFRTSNYRSSLHVESKTRTYLGRVGSGRTAGWRGGVGQDWVPTELFAQETSLPRTFQSIANTSSECLFRCGNPSNFKPIRIDWIVNRPGWVPTPENLLSAAAAFGETPYAV